MTTPVFKFVVIQTPVQLQISALATYDRKRKRSSERAEDLLKSLWVHRRFHDVVIECEERKFEVHRAVLAETSPVFKAMLASGMQEDWKRVVHIDGHPSPALEAMLQYIYTGDLPDSYDSVAVLVLADKYELPGLAQDCVAALLKSMCADNALTVMRTVRPYSDRMHVQPLWAGMRSVLRAFLAEDKVLDECVDSL
eukprot:UN0993